MALLNYTTTISPQKTVGEISAKLAKAKAQAILTEFDKAGEPTAVSFRINTAQGLLTFRLPADCERVYKVICRDRLLPYSKRTMEHARRVAWRIVKDWVDVQIAMVECGLVDLEQVFLPYVQSADGSTLYEKLKANQFNELALPAS